MKFITTDKLEKLMNEVMSIVNNKFVTEDDFTNQLANKSDRNHTHNYAGSSSAGGAANSVKTNLIIKLNGGNSEGTDLFTFNGSTAKTIDITPSSIGAAAASHGTHLTLGTGSGNAYRGDYGNTAYNHSQAAHAPSNAQKNSDITKAEIEAKLTGAITSHTHSYAGSSSAGGAANSVKTNLIVKLNGGSTEGTDLFTFNGSTAKTINITPSSIGAAAASHGTHLTLGTTSSTAYRGDYGNTAYTHSQAAHAPSNAQKNSDITKAEIEAKLTGHITTHTHNYIVARGNVTCETNTTRPLISGITMAYAYNNGYPTNYGNVLSLSGSGDSQLLIGWSGTSGAHAPAYIRSKRDVADANWSDWAQIYTSANPQPTLNGYSLWTGTQTEYNALSSKSNSTLYFIID